jgi:SAM-dependent methyltransferase
VDWEARFAASDVGTPGPPSTLEGRPDLLASVPVVGRGLDVACGRGTVAVWLALRGLAVEAVDAAPSGLALGERLAASAGVHVRWVEADLTAWRPEPGVHDVVVCQRYRDPALYPALADALAPGGLLVVTVLSEVGDAGGRFRAAPGELLTAFGDRPDLRILGHTDAAGEASLVALRAM